MECRYLPTVPVSEFIHRVIAGIPNQRIPLQGSIELTARCNLHCVHCYIKDSCSVNSTAVSELTHRELEQIIDQISDEGCLWLLLTGGEPLCRDDFLSLYAYAKRKGLLITLFTNGTLLTRSVVDYLAEWPPSLIEVTMYGSTQATYEAVTRVPGSFSRCMNGIEMLLDRKLPLKLKSMVLTLNHHDVAALRAYALSIGVDFRIDTSVNPMLDGNMEPTRFRLTPEAAIELEFADEKRSQALLTVSEALWGAPTRPDALYYCGAGLDGFHIDFQGNLSVCIMSRQPNWDLRRGTFRQGWFDFIPRVISQLRQTRTPCQDCEIHAFCEQCPGWGQLERGDSEKPVEFLCRAAKLRGHFVRQRKNRQTRAADVKEQ